jgi:hypothetical protein
VSKDLAAGRYFSGLRADRIMRTVVRASVQASISAVEMRAAYSWHYPLSHDGVDLGHQLA